MLLPTKAAHNGMHLTGKAAGMTQRIDPIVSKYIKDIVRDGTTDVDSVQKLLKSQVSVQLGSFPPTKDDIRNHIHFAMRAIELSKFDQDNLQKKIEMESSITTRKQFFHPFVKHEDDTLSTEVCEQFSQKLIWVHQEEWQQKLCLKYGNTISLIDATYKAIKCDLPLVFICVRTNVGYCVVAEFVIQDETTQQILEALAILRGWNAEWNPPFFPV